MIQELIRKNRSYRRFDRTPLDKETLRDLVDLARLSPSSSNRQPLRYILVSDPEACAMVFPCLSWAGYLTDWPGPADDELPTGYIIVLSDPSINKKPDTDVGIAAQSILLGAVEKGFGGCMLGSIKRTQLKEALHIQDDLEIKLVIALGRPTETVQIDPVGADGSIRYWRDDDQIHHVPKRDLQDLIVQEF